MENKAIKFICLKGGGVKGCAYAGAFKALETYNLMSGITASAGTSAGSIASFLLSIGYNADEINELLADLNFKSFKSGFNIFRIFTKYGLYSGDSFFKWLESCLIKKNLSKTLTFNELHNLTKTNNLRYKDLYCFATDMNNGSVQGFSYGKTPDIKITDGIRASMAIPYFFKSWKIKDLDNHIFVDGGLVYNYPMSVFDNEEFLSDEDKDDLINHKTIGFFLSGSTKYSNLTYNKPIKFTEKLLSTMLDCEILNFKRRLQDVNRTVFINDFNISAIDFNITKDDISKLYDSGYYATIKFLKNKEYI